MRRERQQCICIPANLPCILILDILVALTATMAKYNDRNNKQVALTATMAKYNDRNNKQVERKIPWI